MKIFDEIDAKTINQDPRVVAKLVNGSITDDAWYLLLVDKHLILANTEYFTNRKTGEQKWISAQIEFPKQGIVWFCDTIKNKFFKTAADGGLPKGKFGTDELIEGERLDIYRAANAGGPGMPGYTFTMLDRIKPSSSFPINLNLSDKLLFEDGLFAVFESVADKIRQGIL